MLKLDLRTKFLVSLLVVSASVIAATLWMVSRSVRVQLQRQIADDLHNSLVVFGDFQRQREIGLASAAELLANLPNLKALMTTNDAATIQDASADVWRLIPADVFVLADRTGKVMAIHTSIPGLTRTDAQTLLKDSLPADQPSFWWYGGGHLYQLFLQPIYFGPREDGTVLGFLGVGHEIDELLAHEVSRVASSQVAFFYGNTLIASTVQSRQEALLPLSNVSASDPRLSNPTEVRIGDETFLATTVQLTPSVPPYVRLMVLKSYD